LDINQRADASRSRAHNEPLVYPAGQIVQFEGGDEGLPLLERYLDDVASLQGADEGARLSFPSDK